MKCDGCGWPKGQERRKISAYYCFTTEQHLALCTGCAEVVKDFVVTVEDLASTRARYVW